MPGSKTLSNSCGASKLRAVSLWRRFGMEKQIHVFFLLAIFVIFSAKAQGFVNDPVLIGTTRWDAYAKNREPGSIYMTVIYTMGQKKWDDPALDYWPWFTEVDADGNLVDMNENTVAIMEQENDYAHNAGIDYWAFLRYNDFEDDPRHGWMNEQYYRYQESANKSLMKFCWILSHSFSNWEKEKPKIINAMKDSQWVKVLGNRPLIYFYDDVTPVTSATVNDLRSSAQSAGLGNPYVVKFRTGGIGEDASAVYFTDAGTEEGLPYASFIHDISNRWPTQGSNGPFVPNTPMNDDNRVWGERSPPWGGGGPYWVVPPTPSEFAEMVQKGVDFVKANPKKCPANTVIIKEWNGPEESGLVMPARHHGADKLNGLMNVNKNRHVAEAPEILEARVINCDRTKVRLRFTQGVLLPSDTLGHTIKQAFSFGNRFQVVDSVRVDTAMHTLTLFMPASLDSFNVSYFPYNYYSRTIRSDIYYEGPWLKNKIGVGALPFYRFPIADNDSCPYFDTTGYKNFARIATASASSTQAGYNVNNVNDGIAITDFNSWASTSTPAWLQLDFPATVTFNKVELYTTTDYELKDYSIQYWDGTSWVDAAVVTGNTMAHRTTEFSPVTCSRMRVYATTGSAAQFGYARICELEVYNTDGGVRLEEDGVKNEPISLSVYPSPFNPTTQIRYNIPRTLERIELSIYDAAGRFVRSLPAASGSGSVMWNGEDNSGKKASSGVYIVRLKAGNQVVQRRGLFVK